MTLILIAVATTGFTLGFILHKWIVKEDLLIAEKVKVLVGQKLAAVKAELAKIEGVAKADAAKIEAEVKVEEKKI